MGVESVSSFTEAEIIARVEKIKDHCVAWRDYVSGGKPYPGLNEGDEVILNNLRPLPNLAAGLPEESVDDSAPQHQSLSDLARASLARENLFRAYGVGIGARGKVILNLGENNLYVIEFTPAAGLGKKFLCGLPITSFQEFPPQE
jgi:hypothetical protein